MPSKSARGGDTTIAPREVLRVVSGFPEYLGREVVLPTQGERKYTVIVRFDGSERLKVWAEYEETV
jgi:antibiotic biosynthesis monooxygenase (ABM) superfamily enzyme